MKGQALRARTTSAVKFAATVQAGVLDWLEVPSRRPVVGTVGELRVQPLHARVRGNPARIVDPVVVMPA